jgi:hypothetical protein
LGLGGSRPRPLLRKVWLRCKRARNSATVRRGPQMGEGRRVTLAAMDLFDARTYGPQPGDRPLPAWRREWRRHARWLRSHHWSLLSGVPIRSAGANGAGLLPLRAPIARLESCPALLAGPFLLPQMLPTMEFGLFVRVPVSDKSLICLAPGPDSNQRPTGNSPLCSQRRPHL